ncbi:MAG: tetratricopeptide repeat protein, partial [Calditrichota bacterium]
MSSSTVGERSFYKNLLARRVPQILGSYLIGGWAIVQFVDWNVKRYVLSPYLTDLALVIVLSLIPTVTIIAWFHGMPGRNAWTRVEKVGIPLNLLATMLLLMVVFQNKDLGAASKNITIENEDGQRIERTVFKSGLRKKISLFNFDNKTGNADNDWLRSSIAYMVEYDLAQDHFVSILSLQQMLEKARKGGSSDGNNIPLRLKQKIAQELNQDYFLAGTIRSAEGTYTVETILYEAERAKVLAKRELSNTNLFELIDEISIQLRRDLEIPAAHIENNQDLPVQEIFTGSVPAAKALDRGINEVLLRNNYSTSDIHFHEALKHDSLFTLAHLQLFVNYANNNQTEASREPLAKTMKYLYKLPENSQFMVKSLYYMVNEQPDKQLAVLKMWQELYPDDNNVYFQMANYYQNSGDTDLALQAYRDILTIDPGDVNVIMIIGDLQQTLNRMDEALKEYNRALELGGENSRILRKIGTIYELQGQYAEAREFYNRAILLDDSNKNLVLDLGDILLREGDLEAAKEKYESVIKSSSVPSELASAYNRLESFYAHKGMLGKAVELMEKKWAQQRKTMRPLNMQFALLFDCARYVDVGKPQKALQLIDNLEMFSPFDKAKSFGYLRLYVMAENLPKAKEILIDAKEFVRISGMGWTKLFAAVMEGGIFHQEGNFEGAIEKYKEYREQRPR